MLAFIKTIVFCLATFIIFTSNAAQANHHDMPLDASQWSYAIDPYGSEAKIGDSLVTKDGIWINFKRIPRVDAQRNSWIEVIYSPKEQSLAGKNKIRLTYQCDIPLLIKLSQEHYGKDGDNSYAHYQIKLPAANQWNTIEVDLKDFYRPDWTPASSTDYGIVQDKINALYLTPSLTDDKGGEATLQVRAIELLP